MKRGDKNKITTLTFQPPQLPINVWLFSKLTIDINVTDKSVLHTLTVWLGN